MQDDVSKRIDEILLELEKDELIKKNKLKILIIDDSETARRSVIRSLSSKKQIEFVEARNGVEGFMQLGRHSDIEVIFLDVNMPVMNGHEFFTKGMEAKVLSNIPVVMCTSVADRNTVIEFLRLGISAYIVKPYNEEEFLRIAQSVLSANKRKTRR